MSTKAEIETVHLRVKEGKPATTRLGERHEAGSPSQSSEGTHPIDP
jgi:hypothetical protein